MGRLSATIPFYCPVPWREVWILLRLACPLHSHAAHSSNHRSCVLRSLDALRKISLEDEREAGERPPWLPTALRADVQLDGRKVQPNFRLDHDCLEHAGHWKLEEKAEHPRWQMADERLLRCHPWEAQVPTVPLDRSRPPASWAQAPKVIIPTILLAGLPSHRYFHGHDCVLRAAHPHCLRYLGGQASEDPRRCFIHPFGCLDILHHIFHSPIQTRGAVAHQLRRPPMVKFTRE